MPVLDPNMSPLHSDTSIRALSIDLDGTLVDTMGDFVAVLHLCLQDMRLAGLSEDVVRGLVGKGSEHLIRSVLALRVPDWPSLTEAAQQLHFQSAWQLYVMHYTRINGTHSRLYPGVMDGLQAISRMGLPIACLTNKPHAFALPLLEHLGIAHFFEVVHGGDSFSCKKPHPMPLLKTAEALGVAPPQMLMVGDSSNDALAARAAGCPVALVSYGYNHGEDVSDCPHDWLIDSLEALPSIVRRPPEAFAKLSPCSFTAPSPQAAATEEHGLGVDHARLPDVAQPPLHGLHLRVTL
jgi:phosphoglycolate phosphatase